MISLNQNALNGIETLVLSQLEKKSLKDRFEEKCLTAQNLTQDAPHINYY